MFDSGLMGEGVLHLLAWAKARLLTADATLVSSACNADAGQHLGDIYLNSVDTLLVIGLVSSWGLQLQFCWRLAGMLLLGTR